MGILEQINEIIDKEIRGNNGIEVYGLNVARNWGKTTFNISCREATSLLRQKKTCLRGLKETDLKYMLKIKIRRRNDEIN